MIKEVDSTDSGKVDLMDFRDLTDHLREKVDVQKLYALTDMDAQDVDLVDIETNFQNAMFSPRESHRPRQQS